MVCVESALKRKLHVGMAYLLCAVFRDQATLVLPV